MLCLKHKVTFSWLPHSKGSGVLRAGAGAYRCPDPAGPPEEQSSPALTPDHYRLGLKRNEKCLL